MANKTFLHESAYLQYLALGPERSLTKLAEVMGKAPVYVRMLKDWSRKYDWVKRARSYDAAELQKLVDEEARARLAAIQEMNERHIKMGKLAQARAYEQIETLIAADSFGSLAAVQLLKLAVDIERNAYNLPEKLEIAGANGGPIVITTSWGTPRIERD